MRYMGIDYGTKKIGVAFSNEDGTMAFPHSVLPNDASLSSALETLIEEKGVEEMVVGHSKNRDGSENVVQGNIDSFIGDMTLRTGLPIHLEPEEYSTKEALRLQGRTKMTDASAAAIILNSYLNKLSHSDDA